MAVPETRWARTIDGVSIAYQDLGEGSVSLVVIHGWISHMEVYWEQPRFARFMRRLSRGLRVLHFDKRGVGMSDRLSSPPSLEARSDDVRAVMDAAGVEQAALLGWGTGGPPLALFFAAANPDRVLAVCTDSWILDRRASGYPWGLDEEEHERTLSGLVEAWGDVDRMEDFVAWAFGVTPGDSPRDDPEFLAWCSRFARYGATPANYAAFDRVWYETDVRDVLAAVQVPSLVLYKTDASIWGDRAHAAYLAGRIPLGQLARVPGSAPVVWMEEPEPFVAAVEAFLATLREHAADLDRVLATVLFTDIVGSTDAASQLGDHAWKNLVERHHTTNRALLARYRGNEVDTSGDGFLASFDGPARAVRCAEAIIAALEPLGLQIRAGIHTGEVEMIDGKVGGMAVNIGARIGAMAEPSEVLVSQTVKDLVVGSHIVFENRGGHHLKGVSGDWRLYRVNPGREALSATHRWGSHPAGGPDR